MTRTRLLSLLLLVALTGLGIYVYTKNPKTPKERTYEVLFQVIGKPLKTVDRTITKIFNITDKDESLLGKELTKNLKQHSAKISPKLDSYLQDLIRKIAHYHNPKNLDWVVYVYEGEPNAYALPGGVIAISTGMLKDLETEAELVAVLSHEKGHIDLGHCIDLYRFQAAQNKWLLGQLTGGIASTIADIFLKHSYSKYQENEADQYAFETMIGMHYNPLALSAAFEKLEEHSQKGKSKGGSGILNDYLQTHPSLDIRIDHWKQIAHRYLELNKNQKYEEVPLSSIVKGK